MLQFCSSMYRIRRTVPAIHLFILVFAFVLTGCGASASAGPGASSGAQTPVPSPTPAGALAYGNAQGCPSNAVVTSPPKATITVAGSGKDETIQAHAGDVIEFRFPFGKKWSGPNASQGGLDLQSPAGYASKVNGACVWDFAAKSTGSTQLTFNSQPLCKPGQMCPLYIAVVSYTVQIK
ncbi:MAG: hypothetical protein NVS2B12_25090 [Ktedonobacteraceae bacterium]